LPGWLTHSGHLTTKWSHVNHRSGKVHQPKTDVLTTEPSRNHSTRKYNWLQASA